MDYLASYLPKGQPLARADAVVQGNRFRFTVLTPRMLRLEYHPDGLFLDAATQTVVNRHFPLADFTVREKADALEIITSDLHLRYDKKPFSPEGLSVELKRPCSPYNNRWHYGEIPKTLSGTARTLDEADGAVPLSEGLLAYGGLSLIDDSHTAFFGPESFLCPRDKGGIDLYILGYGHDYLGCLNDFYCLSGPVPMLPRFALGNWWSRFHRYTDESYRALVERFKADGVPLSVSVIDMDWHLTQIDPKYGSGWTGYTWNRDFFPDPKAFLDYLHENQLHVTLNVHPADGCRAHEDAYTQMAEALCVSDGEKIDFDASDPQFLSAYLRYLHHPHEALGVDFWWIDWQQTGGTRQKGLDPLFILNHYHYHDNGRGGQTPLTFSRYAGLGSHRTPIGFSGDTFATWESLAFQPYFTATASNVGYGWWSHDIGGHMHGTKDDDLAIRWLQLGVFSPIMRLHSANNPFMSKEPWSYDSVRHQIARRFMRLRHQLIPYLHTMNAHAHFKGVPLVTPMYYHYPDTAEAYQVPNEYCFGTQLLVCPITRPLDPVLMKAAFDAWLPEGIYFDVFSGRMYRGGRRLTLYRGMEDIPVLARAGGIVPLASEDALANGAAVPDALDILLFGGADGAFTLYEGGEDKAALTRMTLEWGQTLVFTVHPVSGHAAIAPAKRRVTLKVYGLLDIDGIAVTGAAPLSQAREGNITILSLGEMDSAAGLEVRIVSGALCPNDVAKDAFTLLNAARLPYDDKSDLMTLIHAQGDPAMLLSELMARYIEPVLLSALTELITA